MADSRSQRVRPVAVYLEAGRKRTFALAVDWPGWARSGNDEEAALEALADYAGRYAIVARAAGRRPPATADSAVPFDVVERMPGNATTEFGAPGVVPKLDHQVWPVREAKRHAELLAAAWDRLDDVVAGAPASLRKGPRGGGRDRDAIVDHVLGAEHAFRRKAGLKVPPPKDRAANDRLREQFLDLLRAGYDPSDPDDAARAWPLPYAARRIAWHVLDHAWEIEDRADPDPAG
jgi:hypothetical protein